MTTGTKVALGLGGLALAYVIYKQMTKPAPTETSGGEQKAPLIVPSSTPGQMVEVVTPGAQQTRASIPVQQAAGMLRTRPMQSLPISGATAKAMPMSPPKGRPMLSPNANPKRATPKGGIRPQVTGMTRPKMGTGVSPFTGGSPFTQAARA